jgi:hypothetical protein
MEMEFAPMESESLSAKEIAERAMPGWTAVTSQAIEDAPETVESDAQLPSQDALREKYLGTKASDATPAAESTEAGGTTEVVTMRAGRLIRNVGVNTAKGVVTWRQG